MRKYEENISGYPGYHVTKNGMVLSNKRGKWKLLSNDLSTDSTGTFRSLRVGLTNDKGKLKHIQVSRLVALAYIPNIDKCRYVVHKDGNQSNNNYRNLEWSNNNQKYNTQKWK